MAKLASLLKREPHIKHELSDLPACACGLTRWLTKAVIQHEILSSRGRPRLFGGSRKPCPSLFHHMHSLETQGTAR